MVDLLFLAHRAPFPPDRGDKIRSFHVLRHLAARARVHLVAFAEDPRDRVPPPELAATLASATLVPRTKSRARAAVEALATGRPVSLAAFADPALAAAIRAIRDRHRIAATYVFSGQMAQYLQPGDPDERIVIDFVDVDSAKFAAYADAARWPITAMLRREARLLARFEQDAAGLADANLLVSEPEAALFRAAAAPSRAGRARVLAVENGIDAALFDPGLFDPARVVPVAEPGPLLVFTGQMDYPPNIAAVAWFAEAVLPLVRRRHPAARFAIVGRAPTAAVRALAARDGVLVTGEVADVRGWLAAATVVVAPLRLARGIQNKVLEAMAMARPVVASPAAAEGIDHRGTLRIADAATAFADVVSALLTAPASAAALGASARQRVIDRYGWDARLAPLDALFGFAAADRAAA